MTTDYELTYVPLNRAKVNAVILALDCSSTTIGWIVWDGSARDQGTVNLIGTDIADRCRQAFACVGLMIETHPDIDCVAIESPVAQFAKAVIPQARVSGAVLARAALFGLHVIEVTPSQAKRRLCGLGNASKDEMQRAALCYGVTGEHTSDALGIALFAARHVQVMA